MLQDLIITAVNEAAKILELEKYLDRNLLGGEGEGMTFLTKENGETVLVAMDMGAIFINAFVREYNVE